MDYGIEIMAGFDLLFAFRPDIRRREESKNAVWDMNGFGWPFSGPCTRFLRVFAWSGLIVFHAYIIPEAPGRTSVPRKSEEATGRPALVSGFASGRRFACQSARPQAPPGMSGSRSSGPCGRASSR